MNSQTNSEELHEFDWPLAYEAEKLLRRFIRSFLEHNEVASQLARDLRQRTGTDFYEWVDHFSLETEHAEEARGEGHQRRAAPGGHVPHGRRPSGVGGG